MLRDAVTLTAKSNHISCSATEPRFIKIVRCGGCGDEVCAEVWRKHADNCAMLPDVRRGEKPHASGPDIELVMDKDHVMIDVTVVNPLNPSERLTKPSAIFNAVEKRKEAKYGTEVAKQGARLVVAAITAQGAMSPAFERLIAQIAPDDAYFEARRALVAATVAGSGAALRNAESQLGARSPAVEVSSGADEDEDDGVAAEAEEADAAAEPLPAWMAAMVAQPPSEWGTIVAEAIRAARGDARSEAAGTEGEQPETTQGAAAQQAAPTAAATVSAARPKGTGVTTTRSQSATQGAAARRKADRAERSDTGSMATVIAGERLDSTQGAAAQRAAPTAAATVPAAQPAGADATTTQSRSATQQAVPRLATQIADVARLQSGGAAPAATTTSTTTTATTTRSTRGGDGNDINEANAPAEVALSSAHYGEGAARVTGRNGGARAAHAAAAATGSAKGSTRNNQSSAGPKHIHSRSAPARRNDRFAMRVPDPEWYEAENPFFR
jgi:hypothetical protein